MVRQVRRRIDAPAAEVFDAITDVGRLAEWNDRIVGVEGDGAAVLTGPGSVWVVVMKVLGVEFRSRSEVLELDAGAGVFAHRSQRDDGNPSSTTWRWAVEPVDDRRCDVTLGWELHPRTPTRYLMAAVRRRMIPKEAAASLDALAARCTADARH